MSQLIPLGARCFVLDDDPITDLEERAKNAGLHLVIDEVNAPRPTTGLCVAVGSDPFIQDQVKVNDQIFFGRHSGYGVRVLGVEYRCLMLQEILSVLRPHPSITIPKEAPEPQRPKEALEPSIPDQSHSE